MMMGENRPKHVELTWNNKLIYIVHLVGYFHSNTKLSTSIKHHKHLFDDTDGRTEHINWRPARPHTQVAAVSSRQQLR
jgi:hypothetical protein